MILTLAAFTLGLLLRFDAPSEDVKPLPNTHHDLRFAGSLTEFRG
jgi:hypothetical protein